MAGEWKKTFRTWLTPTPLPPWINPRATRGNDAQLSITSQYDACTDRHTNALVDNVA